MAALATVLLRALPMVGWALVSRSLHRLRRLSLLAVSLVAFAGSVECGVPWQFILSRGLALYAWFAFVSIAWAAALRSDYMREAGRFTVLTWAMVLFVLAPATTARADALGMAVLLGWDAALSATSVWITAKNNENKPNTTGILFFLLIDPTLSYRHRSTPSSDQSKASPGLLRVVVGLLALMISGMISDIRWQMNAQWPPPTSLLTVQSASQYTDWLRSAATLAACVYAAHSGRASVQIGFMRCIGWHTEEGYVYPWTATSSDEFWRRWNRWVYRWVVDHLFHPMSRTLHRFASPRVSTDVSMVLSFVIVGVLHDYASFSSSLDQAFASFAFPYTASFLVFGSSAVAWLRIRRRVGIRRRHPWLLRLLGWLVWMHILLGVLTFALPWIGGT